MVSKFKTPRITLGEDFSHLDEGLSEESNGRMSDAARLARFYRARPDRWAEDYFDIELAKCRSRVEIESWMERQPLEEHVWLRKNIEHLSFDDTFSYQGDFLRQLANPGLFAVKWANGVAKTATVAIAIHWFLHNYPGGRVVTTAGTWSQLKEQLWSEVKIWSGRSRLPIAAGPARIGKTQIDLGADWKAFGRAATEEGTFEGVHGEYVMVVMDEAKVIKPGIFNAVRRILRGNPGGKFWWVAISTPGSPAGPFYDICHGDKSSRWNLFSMSGYESERIDLQIMADDATEIGQDSPLFISMNCGEFPEEGEDTIIPLNWINAAASRVVSSEGRIGGGLDIARFGGDETVGSKFKGGDFKIDFAYTGRDLTETTGRARLLAADVQMLGIDEVGLGAGVVDRLNELKVRNILPLNAGSKPYSSDYFNLGAEMMWALRSRFRMTHELEEDEEGSGISIEPDKKLMHQLVSRIYTYTSDGRIKIESKADMVKRGVKSPDRAESMMFANWAQGKVRDAEEKTSLRINAEATAANPYNEEFASSEPGSSSYDNVMDMEF